MSLEDLLPEDIPDRQKAIEQFKDVPALLSSYRELRKNMDSSVRVPTPETSQEERQAFFQRLGTPESLDGYEVEEGTEEWATKAREAAHKAHLTKDQWTELAKAQKEMIQSQREEWEKKLTSSQEESKSRYGESYQEKVDKAKAAMETLASKNEFLAESFKGIDLRDTGALELFNMVGDMMTDGSAPSDGGTGESSDTGDDIQLAMDIRALMKSPAFSKRSDPEHEKTQHEYLKKLQVLLDRGYTSVHDPVLKEKLF